MAELAIGAAALGAATTAAGAYAQNQAIRSAAGSQAQAATIQGRQVANHGLNERQEQRRVSDQIAARTRVLSIAAGGSGGDTIADIDRTIAFDAARNTEISRQNENARINALRSGYQANLAQLRSQTRNFILDTVVGGLQGLSTGLSIDTAGRDAGWWK